VSEWLIVGAVFVVAIAMIVSAQRGTR